MHNITELLESNDFVRCLLIDFCKAFDTVDHILLLTKLTQLDIPRFAINWTVSFLTGRGQQCRVNEVLSKLIHIRGKLIGD